MEKIHWWNFPNYVYFELNDGTRKDLFLGFMKGKTFKEAAEILNESAPDEYNLSAGDIHCWMTGLKKGEKCRIPKWALEELCKITSFDRLSIEKNIITYKYSGRGIEIRPKLPILVTPEFSSIFTHFLGDGHLGKDKCNYKQLNKDNRENFLKKVRYVFGEFNVAEKSMSDGDVLVPTCLVQIMKDYYDFSVSGWNSTYIPRKILNSSEKYKLSSLTAFIVDEGHVSKNNIELYSHNRDLLNGIHVISKQLGYNPTDIKSREIRTSKSTQYRFRINKEGKKKLKEDIEKLKKENVLCDLAGKQNLL